MITLPIWLFIACVIIGFPLMIIILTIIGYVIYFVFNITLEMIKLFWNQW